MNEQKNDRISAEVDRLQALFDTLPQNLYNLNEGLVKRAAYMRVTLEDYEADLDEKGYVEEFSQSEKTEPYERERPVARLYNTMIKNYASTMKQLAEKLPEQAADDAKKEINDFIGKGKK